MSLQEENSSSDKLETIKKLQNCIMILKEGGYTNRFRDPLQNNKAFILAESILKDLNNNRR